MKIRRIIKTSAVIATTLLETAFIVSCNQNNNVNEIKLLKKQNADLNKNLNKIIEKLNKNTENESSKELSKLQNELVKLNNKVDGLNSEISKINGKSTVSSKENETENFILNESFNSVNKLLNIYNSMDVNNLYLPDLRSGYDEASDKLALIKNDKIKSSMENIISFIKKIIDSPAINYTLNNIDNMTILNTANQADINMFFNMWGITVFQNFLRLSLQVNGDVYLGLSKIDALNYQHNVNRTEWTNFERNFKKVPGKHSKIVEVYGEEEMTVVDEWEKIIKANPNKKINVWFRTGTTEYWKLRKYSNVMLHAVEENPSRYPDWIPEITKTVDNYKNTNKINLDNNYLDFLLLNKEWDNKIHFWWSDQLAYDYFKTNNISGHHVFNGTDPVNAKFNIYNNLFGARDKDGKRLGISWWSKISGNNWEQQRDFVYSTLETNKTMSIVYLGSPDEPREVDIILTLWKKYHKNYDIFYKGHPGHLGFTEKIAKLNDLTTYTFTNMLTNKPDTFTKPQGRKIYILEAQIPSEELTTYHVKDVVDNGKTVKGMHFDKFATSAFDANAIYGILNGYNDYKTDLLMAGSQFGKSFMHIDDPESMKPYLERMEARIKGSQN